MRKSIESKARTVSSENNRVVVDVILNEGYTVEQFEEIINELLSRNSYVFNSGNSVDSFNAAY